jgi:hypothetical protein
MERCTTCAPSMPRRCSPLARPKAESQSVVPDWEVLFLWLPSHEKSDLIVPTRTNPVPTGPLINTALGSDGQGQTSFSSVFLIFLILFEFLSFFSSSGACFYVTCVRLGASMPALL